MKNLILGLALFLGLSMYAQRSLNNTYWNSWRYTPKQGMTNEFEGAVAKKMKMFNSSAETSMMTYKIVTGRNSGTYERVEANKNASHYDMDRSAESSYWQKNVSQFVDKSSGQLRWDLIQSMTLNWDPDNPGKPSKYLERTTFDVKPGGTMHFRRFIGRLTKIQEKRGFKDRRLVFRCISGSSKNMYVIVRGWNNYTDRMWPETEYDETFREEYNKEFGWGSLDEDQKNFYNSLENWGETAETLELVPSLTTSTMN